MLRAVKLYNQLCLCAIEICNVLTENLLSVKPDRILPQKAIPQAAFLLGHVLPKRFCI